MTNALTKEELTYCKDIIEFTIFNISEITNNLKELNNRYTNEEKIKNLLDLNDNNVKNNIDNFLKKLKIFYEFTEKLKTICEKNLEKSKLEEKYISERKITEFNQITHDENNTFKLKDLIFLQNNILEPLISESDFGLPFSLIDQDVLKENNLKEAQGKFANIKSNLTAFQNPIKELIKSYDRDDDFFQFDNFEKIKKIPEEIYNSEDSQKQIIFINFLSEFDFEIKESNKKIFNFFLKEKLINDKWLFDNLSSSPELYLSKKFKINLLEKLLYARQIQLKKQNEYEVKQETLKEFFNYLFDGIKLNNLDQKNYSSISQKIKELMEIYKKDIASEKEEKKKKEKEEEAILTPAVKDKISSVSATLIANLFNNDRSRSSAVLFKVDKKNRTLYFATNKHCVEDAVNVSIQILNLKSERSLNIFSSNQILKNNFLPDDIAFIKLPLPDCIDINNFQEPEIFEGEIKENDIVIASRNREFTTGRSLNNIDGLNHNAKIKDIHSGGGLFNSEGKLIGINYEKNYAYGFGNAVPISRVKEIFDDLVGKEKQEAEEKQKINISKFKKHLGVFIISDLIAASVIYFSMTKLIENNKLQNMNKNLAFGCIALVSIALLFFEIKALINDQKEILSTKTEIEGLETLIKKNKPVIPSS